MRHVALMQSDAGPGQPLHVRHRRPAIEIGVMPSPLAQDAVDSPRRTIAASPGRDARGLNQRLASIQGERLLVQGNHDLKRIGWNGFARRFARPGGIGRRRRKRSRRKDEPQGTSIKTTHRALPAVRPVGLTLNREISTAPASARRGEELGRRCLQKTAGSAPASSSLLAAKDAGRSPAATAADRICNWKIAAL